MCPKKSIYFDNHQILAPAQTISESQFKIKHLALNSLCGQIFKETTEMQVWKKELEEQQALLKFKLSTERTPGTQADFKETRTNIVGYKKQSQVNQQSGQCDR